MALSEIEKLERRYAENPSGLTFAPLAEVHRKNGDVGRALDLLKPGLEIHPDYIPASIVLGRCHLDLGDLPSAEAAFAHVLALDGENVIALKALADIAERQHHFDEAERRLQMLLSVDRSNDDARAQLERIESARRDAAAAPPPPSESAAAAESGPAPERESSVAATAEPAPAWMSAPEAPEPPEPVEAEPLPLEDLEPALLVDDTIEPPPEGLVLEEPQSLEEPIEPIVGLVGRDVDEAGPDGEGFRVEQSEDIVLRSSGGSEFQVPDASLELSDRVVPPMPSSPFFEEPAPGFGSVEEPAPEPPAPAEPESPPEPEPVAEPPYAAAFAPPPWPTPVETAPSEPVPEPVVEPVPEPVRDSLPEVVAAPEPEPVVTESMAEVLRQQGHSVEALRVYRALEVRTAGDPRLRQKIEELEQETRAPEPPTPLRRYTAAETGGRSVGDYLRGVLAARPPAAASAPRPPAAPNETSGAPTRPAPDALSLSSVFGEETTPLPPAVPAGGPPAGVSFDEFYGASGPGAASQKGRAPDPKNDDLDQFHAWLQNLKR